jgi:two-component sensor histidine kinase
VLLMEVNHRSKNMLSIVQALARRSADGNKQFVARFEDRLRSLAVNQDILVRRAWREVPMTRAGRRPAGVLRQAPAESWRSPARVRAGPARGGNRRMALHELATNALKYGALAPAGGHVSVGWDCPPGAFTVWWHESGGAPGAAARADGFRHHRDPRPAAPRARCRRRARVCARRSALVAFMRRQHRAGGAEAPSAS